MKKLIFLITTFLLFLNNSLALELNSKYAVLYNLNEEKIVYEENKDEVTSIASLTKIMTVLVALENESNLDKKVTISSLMFEGLEELGAYQIGLKNNQIVTLNDLLYGTLLASGADCARALAISIAGSEDDFVKLMNNKAQELKLENTHFAGTVGLDDDEHYSTVDEVAKLLIYALKNPTFSQIFTTDSYSFSDQSFTVKSSMKQTLNAYHLGGEFILGGKTGFTKKAGRCLASIAYDNKNDIKYLLVTTNAEQVPNHVSDAINIYEYYFNNYKYQELIKKNETILTLPTENSNQKEVIFKSPKAITKYLPNDYDSKDITLEYQGTKIINPALKKGSKLGNLTVKYQDEKVQDIPIILNETVKFSLIVFILSHKLLSLIIFIIILLVIFLILKKKKAKVS